MDIIHIGKMIGHLREQAEMSMEDLAYDIISTVTLWRIETGRMMPSKKKQDLLFERLGVNPSSLNTIFVNNEGANIHMLKDKLDSYLVLKNVEAASDIISKLESDMKFMADKRNHQYVLAAKATNAVHMGVSPGEAVEMFTRAMVTAWNVFSMEKIEKYYLTKIDFTIIDAIALQYFALGEHDQAVQMLYGLKKNVEKNCIDKIERGIRYPLIIFNLTSFLFNMGKHKDVIALCDEGRRVCLDTGYLMRLPNIMYNKARSLFEIGEAGECEQILREVFYAYGLLERQADAAIIKNYASKRSIVL